MQAPFLTTSIPTSGSWELVGEAVDGGGFPGVLKPPVSIS